MSDWSSAEDRKILRMWCADEPPRSTREIADDLERSKSSVYRRIRALGIDGHKGDRRKYEEMTGISLEPVIKPVRVDLPEFDRPDPGPTASFTMLVWGDTQHPFQDQDAVSILYQITEDLKPDMLVCLGDIFDFPELSDYRDIGLPQDLQESIDAGVAHLGKMIELAEPSKAHFLAGNHEDRWDRLLAKARRDVRMRQLLQLPKIKRSLEFEEIAGFDDLGYDYMAYKSKAAGELQALVVKDRLVIVHGDKSNKWVTRSMLERFGKSVIFGHTHRIQNFTKRDLKGQEAGWNIGCLCLLDQTYTHFTDWAHGFAVVDWSFIDGEWLFDVNQVRIHSGRAVFRGKTYTS